MTTDLATKRIQALSQRRTFLRGFTYKTTAKIDWHRTKLRHCLPIRRIYVGLAKRIVDWTVDL